MPPTSGWTRHWPGRANTLATCGACTATTNACNALAAPTRRRSSASNSISCAHALTCRSWRRARAVSTSRNRPLPRPSDGCFVQLDGVAVGIGQLHLLAARADPDVSADSHPCVAQPGHVGLQIVDVEHDPVPT